MAPGERATGPLREALRPRPHRVVALCGPEVHLFELAVAVEVFGLDRAALHDPWYELVIAATTPGPLGIAGGGGAALADVVGVEALDSADTVLVPAWSVGDEPPAAALDALRAAHERRARLVSVCSGAFLFAEAGLLDGRSATTHWMHAEAFRRRHPQVELVPDVLYVDAGDGILTSAGTAAGIDLCLHLVRQDHGAEIANAVARRMVVPPHRTGGQAQYVATPVPEGPEAVDALSATLDWALGHLDQPLTVDDLARRALLSPRTFARRFRAVTGTTPLQWLLRQRVLRAQELLEATSLPVEVVAHRTGFGTAAALRAHFRRQLGTTPVAYRDAFRRSA